jgi:glycosyltransferase involved in cell wall biosynthesis
MRILILSKELRRNGGVGTYLCDLLPLLEQAGHTVAVICAEREQSDIFQLRQPADIRCFVGFDEFTVTANHAQNDAVLAAAHSFQPDVVMLNTMDNVALEARLGDCFPLVRFVHNHVYCPSGLKYFRDSLHACQEPIGAVCISGYVLQRCWDVRRPATASRFFLRASSMVDRLRQSQHLVVASRFVRDRLMENGIDAGHIRILPLFTSLTMPDISPAQADGSTVFWSGRVVPAKGLDLLLQALAKLPIKWRLVVAGDGPALGSARTTARGLGIAPRVEFLGWVDRDQKQRSLAAADIVAVPSVWPEPFGIVGIEAMTFAKPVVAFESGGIPDWLEDGVTGFSVAVGDIDALAARIETLLQSARLRSEMGIHARARVLAEFSAESHLKGLTEVFNSAIDSFDAHAR